MESFPTLEDNLESSNEDRRGRSNIAGGGGGGGRHFVILWTDWGSSINNVTVLRNEGARLKAQRRNIYGLSDKKRNLR